MTGDLSFVDGRIRAGLSRLREFQHSSGQFALWCGGGLGLDITARVVHRLLAFQGLPYADAEQMNKLAAAALLKHGVRDNQLLTLDRRFEDKLATVKDAVALYFYGNGRRKQALDFLHHHARRGDDLVHWDGSPGSGYWGGALEATCDAARVLYDAGDSLFAPAFNYVGARMIGGGLHSTADTRALVELLASLRSSGEAAAIVDGHETTIADATVGQQVTALRDNLLVRVDEELVIDHLTPRDKFRFTVQVTPDRLTPGQRAKVTIYLQEDSLCPLARIYLPGCLALLKAGANAQTAHLPVGVEGLSFHRDSRLLELEAVAVRKGSGRLRVAVHDLYDAEKIGVGPGVAIIVS